MDIKINLNDKEPIYLQIISYVKKELIAENLKPGDVIPSRRELAEIIKVNPNTVQRAYKEMETMGIISTVKNSQSEITLNKELLRDIKKEYIEESIYSFIENMKSINMKKEDIIKLINDTY